MKAILGLEVDGETLGVELGFEALSSVVYSIPDTEENAPIFAALARHPNPSIRSNLTGKENLDEETVLLLAQDKDPNVRSSIPYSETFKRIATLEMLKDMLELEGDAASNIISYAGSFQKVSADEIEQAVKDADIQDPQILMSAAQCWDFSIEFIEELTQHPDVSVANAAKQTVKNR
mgnify:FL=1|tara:strand:- start:90 stop:620 length:531 start_codon:yes stop_codon:yes gene_type:complete